MYILPKSVTSVAVTGGRSGALKKLQLWLEKYASEVEWKNTSLKFIVPTGTNETELREIANLLGGHRVSGGIGPVGADTLVAEFWEYEMTADQVLVVVEILNSKKYDHLEPVILLHCSFYLKIDEAKQHPKSSFLIGLKERSYVMPDIVFPEENIQVNFNTFSLNAPFKTSPKYLRTVRNGVFRKLKDFV